METMTDTKDALKVVANLALVAATQMDMLHSITLKQLSEKNPDAIKHGVALLAMKEAFHIANASAVEWLKKVSPEDHAESERQLLAEKYRRAAMKD